jgi:hypothetical protein
MDGKAFLRGCGLLLLADTKKLQTGAGKNRPTYHCIVIVFNDAV